MSTKEKILRIMELALDINPPDIDEIGQMKTAVFVRWSPHVNVLILDIHYGGWRDNSDPDEHYYVKTSDDTGWLDYIISRLEGILKEVKADV